MSRVTRVRIRESAEELKSLMKQQGSSRLRIRVQALYLLKSGQCQQVQQIAEVVGSSRSTVHRWLWLYQQGGLGKLIGPGRPAGRKPAIPAWALSKLEQRLQQPRGFGSYGEIQQWLARECGVKVSYAVAYRWVRYRLKAKLKVPRPVAQAQEPEVVEAFRAGLGEQLQRCLIACPTQQEIRYWCQDESRFGLKTIERRRITAKGIAPLGVNQWVFEAFWLYGMVEPRTGESFFWEFSHLDSTCYGTYLELFSQHYPNQFHLIQVDQSGAHTAQQLETPDNIRLIFQPAAAPQVNPIGCGATSRTS